ncbi:MAG TPA: hypothetical protein VFE61_13005 [Candidatus Sulfotelmatobacter sp.]|nr:hypothetical protein [Candidatus Sulfotelmatobacter sp.]
MRSRKSLRGKPKEFPDPTEMMAKSGLAGGDQLRRGGVRATVVTDFQ